MQILLTETAGTQGARVVTGRIAALRAIAISATRRLRSPDDSRGDSQSRSSRLRATRMRRRTAHSAATRCGFKILLVLEWFNKLRAAI
jgi:hypothetical protein